MSNRSLHRAAIAAVLLASGCFSEHSPQSVERGFAWMSFCLDRGTGEALFRALDQESQWSVHSIQKLVRAMADAVRAHYPPDRREEALGMWRPYADASTAEALFARLLDGWGGMAGLREGFAPIRSTHVQKNEGTVVTTHGRRYAFRRGMDGRWGLADFHDRLERMKLMAQDHLDFVKKNAAAFSEARQGEGEHAAPP